MSYSPLGRLYPTWPPGSHLTNRHNDKTWNRSGVVVKQRGFGQYQIKLDGSGRLSVRTRAHLKPFQSYPQLGTAGKSAPPLLNPSYSLWNHQDGEEAFMSAPTSPIHSQSPRSSLGGDSPPSELCPSSPEPMETQSGHLGDEASLPHRHSATQTPTKAGTGARRTSPGRSPSSPGQRDESPGPQQLPRRSQRSRAPVDKYTT